MIWFIYDSICELTPLKGSVHIFTDASKTIDNKTSAAFCIPEFNIEHSARLADNITIFAAELCAIKLEVLDTCVRNSLLS